LVKVLFMLAVLGIGVALAHGITMRLGTIAGFRPLPDDLESRRAGSDAVPGDPLPARTV